MKGRFKRLKIAAIAAAFLAVLVYLNNASWLADPLEGGPFLVAHRALGQDFEYLDDQLAGNKFVTGEVFTMGDIPVGAAAHRFFVLPIERPSVPNVEAWYERLQERPAFRECVMVPLP